MRKREKRLAKIDLNQLVSLQTLMEERSVTRAAQRLFLTQSAMSKALKRMRDFFEDPLFLRSPNGLVPTPRMEELSVSINQALGQLEETVFARAFDPATATGAIHISVSDMLSLKAVPELLRTKRLEAPDVVLRTSDASGSNLELLAAGEVDFSIDTAEKVGSDFEVIELERFSPVAWVKRDHPLARRRLLSIDDFAPYAKIMVYRGALNDPAGLSLRIPRSDINAKMNTGRIYSTTHLLTAVEVMLRGEAVMFGPDYVHYSRLLQESLVTLAPRELRELKLSIVLTQHRRTLKSPLHRWIRDKIIQTYKAR